MCKSFVLPPLLIIDNQFGQKSRFRRNGDWGTIERLMRKVFKRNQFCESFIFHFCQVTVCIMIKFHFCDLTHFRYESARTFGRPTPRILEI